MTSRDKFDVLVTPDKNNTLEQAKERIKNRKRLKESQAIAIKVLAKLDEEGWSQKKLAAIMGVSPQQITKIVSGKENLTLQTQVQIQEVLDIPILATYYENVIDKIISSFKAASKKRYTPRINTQITTVSINVGEVEETKIISLRNFKTIFEAEELADVPYPFSA